MESTDDQWGRESKDDPEARIRELERSLGREAPPDVGVSSAGAGYGYVPPPPSAPTQPPAPPPDVPRSGYPLPSYPPTASFGGPFNPIKKKSSLPTGWILAIVGLLILVPVVGAVYAVISATGAVRDVSSFTPPSIPSFVPGGPGTGPTAVPTAAADDHVSLAGASVHGEAVCDGGEITISGVSNVYEISGHCAKVTVSGGQNRITVDSADAVVASGMGNVIVYHSGSPQIDRSGMDNSVERG